LVNTQFFVGTRCRLSRHRDAKFVSGWVQLFRGESLVVTTENALGSEPGDIFFVEAYGPKAKACMEATLSLVETDSSPEDVVQGKEAALHRLSLQIKGHVQVVDHHESSRTLVSGVFATVTCARIESKAEVRDVSPKGLGLVMDQSVEKGADVALKIETSLGPIGATGVVRHVREANGKHRVGIELTNLQRLDASRWRKLVGEAA
jgi:hypothetical protein